MEEMTRKQPDMDRVTKTYKRKNVEPAHGPFIDKPRGASSMCPATVLGRFIPACSRRALSKYPSTMSFPFLKTIGLELKFLVETHFFY